MSKPTEGPYEIRSGHCTDPNNFTPNGAKIVTSDGSLIATLSRKADRNVWEKRANARLLAKSWEMRDLLKSILTDCKEHDPAYRFDVQLMAEDIEDLLNQIDGDSK